MGTRRKSEILCTSTSGLGSVRSAVCALSRGRTRRSCRPAIQRRDLYPGPPHPQRKGDPISGVTVSPSFFDTMEIPWPGSRLQGSRYAECTDRCGPSTKAARGVLPERDRFGRRFGRDSPRERPDRDRRHRSWTRNTTTSARPCRRRCTGTTSRITRVASRSRCARQVIRWPQSPRSVKRSGQLIRMSRSST